MSSMLLRVVMKVMMRVVMVMKVVMKLILSLCIYVNLNFICWTHLLNRNLSRKLSGKFFLDGETLPWLTQFAMKMHRSTDPLVKMSVHFWVALGLTLHWMSKKYFCGCTPFRHIIAPWEIPWLGRDSCSLSISEIHFWFWDTTCQLSLLPTFLPLDLELRKCNWLY